MNKQSGVTLLEILVVAIVGGIVISAVTFAFGVATTFQTTFGEADATAMQKRQFESSITRILEGAVIEEGNDLTYFVLADEFSEDVEPGAITFTSEYGTVSTAYLNSTGDFETLNDEFGPQGGIAEIEISRLPFVGGGEGIYLRRQVPADGDLMQGGSERALLEQMYEIQFECWDGLDWTNRWDTRVGQERLPAAVRVTYAIYPEDVPRTFIVRIPASDVTDIDPYQEQLIEEDLLAP